jgi:S1-C subfamily serine protease
MQMDGYAAAKRPAVAGCRPALVAALLLLASCVQPKPTATPTQPLQSVDRVTSVTVNGVVYTNTTDALAAVRASQKSAVQGLAKEPDPIKGDARIIVPDHDRLRPFVQQQLVQQLKRNVTGAALDYYIEFERNQILAMADALVQAQAFEKISVTEQNDTRNPEIGAADYLVWYQVRTTMPDNTGPWIGHWQIRRAGSVATASAAMDQGTAVGTPRYASFVQSVRDGTRRLAGGGNLAGGSGNVAAPGSTSSGSGFVVNADGNIVTNEHVVRACAAVQVIDVAGATHDATVLAQDANNDLAIVKTTQHARAFATFRDGDGPRPGESIVVMGYALGDFLGSNASVTTGSLTATTGVKNDTRLMQVSAPIQLGNSGGPLLDRNGEVIGVVSGTLNSMTLALLTGVVPQNVNFAIKASLVRSFLDTSKVTYAHSAAHHELSAEDVGELAAKFTVRILCRH